MNILFLDIDGVLNNGIYGYATATGDTLDHRCTAQLSRVIKETGCKLVISSTWRYDILDGEFTLKGFATMLSACGVKGADVVGCTHARGNSRHQQILDWLTDHKVDKYAVVDDDTVCDGQVQPDHAHGLAPWDADKLIEILNGV